MMPDYIGKLRKLFGSSPLIYTGVTLIIRNQKNEILLQQNATTLHWATIGGGLELGETFEEAAKRELLEETGLVAADLKFITLLSGKDLYYKYPNGDEVYCATAVFEAREVNGQPVADKVEGVALQYFNPNALPANTLAISKTILQRAGYLAC